MNLYYQHGASIAIDSSDNLHVVWYGRAAGYGLYAEQIWYTNRTSSWIVPIVISTAAGMSVGRQQMPTIAVDSSDYLHVIWNGLIVVYPDPDMRVWYANYTTSWSTPIHISTLDIMVEMGQGSPSIAIDSSDNLHVVWDGASSNYSGSQVWYNKYNTSWAGPIRISTYSGMNDTSQFYPSITIDSSDNHHVVWDGKATGYGEFVIWYATYTTSWSTPECLQPTGKNRYPVLMWSRWWLNPIEDGEDTFIVTDENGTIVDTWTDNGNGNFTDIDDLKDWIDDNLDPEGGDPLDPTPGTQGFPDEGPFTRFKMRLYILFIGLGCIFMPLWAMAYKKFDTVGYTWCFLIMVLGVGLLWSITGI